MDIVDSFGIHSLGEPFFGGKQSEVSSFKFCFNRRGYFWYPQKKKKMVESRSYVKEILNN